jgi:hypothetical protein
MVRFDDRGDDGIGEAVALARAIAPDVDSVLLTHYPDSETLDTFRPGETDLDAVAAVNRAVAAELAASGVEVFVQKADRGAFRRWMRERDDTPESRRAWIDRSKLLRGAVALRLLGVDAVVAPPPPKHGKAPGPLADRLLALFDEDDGEAFERLAEDLLGAGRGDVLDLAVRKFGGRHGDEAADELEGELLAAAEGAKVGPSGWAELVALPVALPAHAPPDAADLGESLVGSGVLPDTVEVRFLPGWRSPDALAELSPVAVRRVLLDMVSGAEPRDLPPGDTDDLARRGFGVLLGLQVGWDIPVWDEIAAVGGLPLPPEGEDEESPEEARCSALFDRWRGSAFEAGAGCVPLALVPPSEVTAEIADFLEEAGDHAGGIEEIRSFVSITLREAGGEEVVCRPEFIGDGLELSMYTEGGRFLDSLTLPAARMPAAAGETLRLIESFVRVVKGSPAG